MRNDIIRQNACINMHYNCTLRLLLSPVFFSFVCVNGERHVVHFLRSANNTTTAHSTVYGTYEKHTGLDIITTLTHTLTDP